ncbi:MAG: hypothetical protein A2X36_07950 [Elusimicrobia bacterium GWA2_69_24]|nr:MAG: hypothetical protein A2X36_07950 [Elusimicrobia bacterium GWA2_69_24]
MGKDYRLVFYETAAGRIPVRDYLRSQSKTVRGVAGWLLTRLEEEGPDLERPAADHLGDGIYELRIIVAGDQHRILYFFADDTIVTTNAFLKKTRKVPIVEIAKARSARAAWHAGEAAP